VSVERPSTADRLARERTRLAQERTYAAWLRTGLALLGAGLAAAIFLPDSHNSWALRVVGVVLIALSGVPFGFSRWAIKKVAGELADMGYPEAPRILTLGATLLLACSALALAYVCLP
jgi:putative membrane protein